MLCLLQISGRKWQLRKSRVKTISTFLCSSSCNPAISSSVTGRSWKVQYVWVWPQAITKEEGIIWPGQSHEPTWYHAWKLCGDTNFDGNNFYHVLILHIRWSLWFNVDTAEVFKNYLYSVHDGFLLKIFSFCMNVLITVSVILHKWFPKLWNLPMYSVAKFAGWGHHSLEWKFIYKCE